MFAIPLKPIPHIVQQHAEEAAILCNIRSAQVTAPHIKLHHLRRIDDRIVAHLDGLAIAGEYGMKVCEAALESPRMGVVFTLAVRTIETRDEQLLDKLFALVGAVPEAQAGLISAIGWVSSQFLQGIGARLLMSADPFRQQVGVSACAMHRVDPGAILAQMLQHEDMQLRARALRAVGELCRRDLRLVCERYLTDQDVACRFWAAWSAVLLGNRCSGVNVLKTYAFLTNPFQERALHLFLKTIPLPEAHASLKILAQDDANIRSLIQGAGIVGDPHYVPWLIKQMENTKLSRLAGESFSFITGLDLAYLDLDRDAPKDIDLGPNDDPADDDVAMDEDDNLPWPDPEKLQTWWNVNKPSFSSGERYFMGKRVAREHCLQVLKEGYQRQRIAAAQYLCLLESGSQLFPTSAPAWRQQRWLSKLI